ncbi:pyridoxal phosphate-dependent aminotransferase [Algoriphagus zhangzhouensis]|uniref:alanine transaminase n=1 Tax=Algoriphagus zhangzhouensis TaxID=1073327 RepID=A0A1M7ZIW2_9BACT|nr:pyridoxal phosphate-dependent aminotransferase [Algoriphagus zhangzhouensis]TDY43690.1 aspartate/methionine/tyrosine aminotransferase [Algoriphagus zhangzhouensis]SHO64814.1 Aspartate/methionine/tyrosine aminotransferase [Algoriphagus zhangzhouensis]
MRQLLLRPGAEELSYEIRGIVKKARQIESLGYSMTWENIGDPIQKNNHVPDWMKEIISDLLKQDKTYGYADSKGVLETRQFLADLNNGLGGTQITAEDILFFNGLGDAIAKLYQFLVPTARIIGPSPAYSTHSSAEAAHANTAPITYKLDPDNQWLPDMDDLYMKVKYNPSIVGILIINPDNPTGMVYPREVLEGFVKIAEEFNLLLVVDEIYQNITYNGIKAVPLAEVLGDRPAISLKGISKEFPWPGARCGWMEFYNRESSKEFSKLCQTLENAKMIEVCSTILPQLAIPIIMSHPAYHEYRVKANNDIGRRSEWMAEILGDIPGIKFNPTQGAFYNTIVFDEGVLNPDQKLEVEDPRLKTLVEGWVSDPTMPLDKRFVYYLLASERICVVPISSFCSDLRGFRVTLLEEKEEVFKDTFTRLGKAIKEYLKGK